MKRFALAIALASVLSGSALAGDIHTGQDALAPGDIPSTDAPTPGNMGNDGNQGNGKLPVLLTIIHLLF